MKKILFTLLLFTGFLQAQTYPVNPTKFGKISLNTNGVSTSTSKINTQEADGQINYIDAANLPVPTTVTNALELKTTVSAGAVSGFELTNNGNGTVNIASGIAYLRPTNDPYSSIVKYPISAVTNLALTDNANNYVLVDYNGGSPTITVTTNGSTINTQTNSIAYVIARVGNDLEYLNLVGQNVDPNAKLRVRFLNQEGIRRASGAVLGFSNRNLTLTSSTLFSGLIRLNAPAFNTQTPDTFTLAYNNGSTWTRTTSQTQVNNTQYNASGVLTTMPNNDYRTDYVYLLPNNPSKLYVIMGTTTYNSLTLAKGAPRPSSLPVELQVLGLEVGRLFIQKNSAAVAEVQSSFANDFVGAAVPEHNSLSGLQGGTAGEYNHLTNTQVSGLIQKMSITQIRALTGTLPNTNFYTTDIVQEGNWYYDAADTTSADNTGTVLVTADGKRIKRIIQDKTVMATWFGAVTDWNETTKTATDCTVFIQNAINYLLNNKGGTLILNGRFLVNGTLYVNNPNTAFITIKGRNTALKVNATNAGDLIYRQVSGDVFRVNMNSDGSGFMSYPNLYNGFSIEGIGLEGKQKPDNSRETGMVAVKTFRVQSAIIKNISVERFDYLVNAPSTDSNSIESYNDQWILENVRSTHSTLGFIDMFTTDGMKLSGISIEDPLPTFITGIKLSNSTSTDISNMIFWNPSDGDPTNVGSSVIELFACQGMFMSNFHIERPTTESVIKITSCQAIEFNGIQSRYSSNDFFKLNNNTSIVISGWASWEVKNSGKKDVAAFLNNQYIKIKNSTFRLFPSDVERDFITDGDIEFTRDKFIRATDADYTLKRVDGSVKIILPEITANRTVNLPAINQINTLFYVYVKNTVFNWLTNVPLVMPNGSSITSLKRGSVYVLSGDFEGVYRVISMSSDEAFLGSNNLFTGNNTFSGNNTFTKNLLIGSNLDSTASLRVDKDMTGGVDVSGVQSRGTIQSDATGFGYYFRSAASTINGTNLNGIVHFRASQGVFGTGVIQEQTGFIVENNLFGAVNNYAFRSLLSADDSRWSLYLDGTAKNYLRGNTSFGSSLNNGNLVQIYGTAYINDIKIANSPIVSTGGFDILTRKTDVGADLGKVERVSSAFFAPNLLTGYTSGAGTVSATDNVLQAIQKLNGNINNALNTTVNYIPKKTGTGTLGDSRIYESGGVVIVDGDLGVAPLSSGVITGKLFRTATYLVSNLPASPGTNAYATVTDALAPAYLAPVVGGGSVVCPVFWNGTTWVCH